MQIRSFLSVAVCLCHPGYLSFLFRLLRSSGVQGVMIRAARGSLRFLGTSPPARSDLFRCGPLMSREVGRGQSPGRARNPTDAGNEQLLEDAARAGSYFSMFLLSLCVCSLPKFLTRGGSDPPQILAYADSHQLRPRLPPPRSVFSEEGAAQAP